MSRWGEVTSRQGWQKSRYYLGAVLCLGLLLPGVDSRADGIIDTVKKGFKAGKTQVIEGYKYIGKNHEQLTLRAIIDSAGNARSACAQTKAPTLSEIQAHQKSADRVLYPIDTSNYQNAHHCVLDPFSADRFFQQHFNIKPEDVRALDAGVDPDRHESNLALLALVKNAKDKAETNYKCLNEYVSKISDFKSGSPVVKKLRGSVSGAVAEIVKQAKEVPELVAALNAKKRGQLPADAVKKLEVGVRQLAETQPLLMGSGAELLKYLESLVECSVTVCTFRVPTKSQVESGDEARGIFESVVANQKVASFRAQAEVKKQKTRYARLHTGYYNSVFSDLTGGGEKRELAEELLFADPENGGLKKEAFDLFFGGKKVFADGIKGGLDYSLLSRGFCLLQADVFGGKSLEVRNDFAKTLVLTPYTMGTTTLAAMVGLAESVYHAATNPAFRPCEQLSKEIVNGKDQRLKAGFLKAIETPRFCTDDTKQPADIEEITQQFEECQSSARIKTKLGWLQAALAAIPAVAKLSEVTQAAMVAQTLEKAGAKTAQAVATAAIAEQKVMGAVKSALSRGAEAARVAQLSSGRVKRLHQAAGYGQEAIEGYTLSEAYVAVEEACGLDEKGESAEDSLACRDAGASFLQVATTTGLFRVQGLTARRKALKDGLSHLDDQAYQFTDQKGNQVVGKLEYGPPNPKTGVRKPLTTLRGKFKVRTTGAVGGKESVIELPLKWIEKGKVEAVFRDLPQKTAAETAGKYEGNISIDDERGPIYESAQSLKDRRVGEGKDGNTAEDAHRALAHPDVRKLWEQHKTFNEVKPADNKNYMETAAKANPDVKLVVEVENAVLKQLNDKVFHNKDVVTALSNQYKKMFFDRIHADSELSSAVIARYSDFKGVGIALNDNSPRIQTALNRLHADVAKSFADAVTKSPVSKLVEGQRGLSGDPANWHLAGTGSTIDEAAAVARELRSDYESGKVSKLGKFSDYKERLTRRIADAETIRAKLQNDPSSDSKVMVPSRSDSSRKVLSVEAIELLRKVSAKDLDEYVSLVQARFKKRFKIELTREFAIEMGDYYNLVDKFSPKLLQEKRVVIDLSVADQGIVSVDFAGQGARNIHETMNALSEVHETGADMTSAMNASRAGELRATQKMQALGAKVIDSVATVFAPKERSVQFSGDDGIFMPEGRALERADKIRFVGRLASTPEGARLRVTFLPPKYSDGKVIPVSERSSLIVKAEGVEKALLSELEGRLGFTAIGKTMFAIDLVPNSAGGGKINIVVGGEAPPAVMRELGEALKRVVPENYQNGEIILERPVGLSAPSIEVSLLSFLSRHSLSACWDEFERKLKIPFVYPQNFLTV